MSSISSLGPRTSDALRVSDSLRSIASNRSEIDALDRQIATGRAVQRPSEARGRASSVLFLRERIDARAQDQRNLDAAARHLLTAERGLGEATEILNEARGLALREVGVTSSPGQREQQAAVVDGQLAGLQRVANQAFNTLGSFAGRGAQRGAAGGASGGPFESFLGGVRYTGTAESLRAPVGEAGLVAFTSNGGEGFGALDARVAGAADLAPAASADTRLADLGGALGAGVRRGAVRVQVGAASAVADLSDADTLGGVAARINAAIAEAAPGAAPGAVSVAAGGLLLSSSGPAITLSDPAGGSAAADLGVDGLSAAGGAAAGADPGARLTPETPLSALPGPLDLASGVTVSQGGREAVLDFAGASTVQDLQNAVSGLGLGLRLEIAAGGGSLELVQEVAGLELSVGENGGSTAADLGVATLGAATGLGRFRHGLGVEAADGVDFSVTLSDGTAFGVDLSGAATVAGVIARTDAAAAAAGVPAGSFALRPAAVGAGLVFDDDTGGPGSLSVASEGQSRALVHLGFPASATADGSGELRGSDAATLRVENAFTHLTALAAALRGDDALGITLAGSGLEADARRAVSARGAVSVRAASLEDARERAIDLNETETALLSELIDADLPEVVARYQQLQTQLQASFQTTAQTLRLSLFDFLT